MTSPMRRPFEAVVAPPVGAAPAGLQHTAALPWGQGTGHTCNSMDALPLWGVAGSRVVLRAPRGADAYRARGFVQTISRAKFAREFLWTFSLAIFTSDFVWTSDFPLYPLLSVASSFSLPKPRAICKLEGVRPCGWVEVPP